MPEERSEFFATINAQAIKANGNCVVIYKEVDVSAEDYRPSRPFRGLAVLEDGNVNIVGLDGGTAVLALLAAGSPYPYGGQAILSQDTDAVGIVALF